MANIKSNENKTKAQSMGLHTEVLTGKTQQKFFNPDEAENFYYFGTYDEALKCFFDKCTLPAEFNFNTGNFWPDHPKHKTHS